MNRSYQGQFERVRLERERRREENFGILIKQLGDSGISYRVRAAEALGIAGDLRAVPYLISCIKCEKDPGVLYVAVCSLGKLKDKSAVASLLSLLEHNDRWVRRGAASALGMIGDRDAVFYIKPMLNDPSPEIRATAAEALGMMSYWDVVDDIIPLLDDEEGSVRAAARSAVKRLGRGDLSD